LINPISVVSKPLFPVTVQEAAFVPVGVSGVKVAVPDGGEDGAGGGVDEAGIGVEDGKIRKVEVGDLLAGAVVLSCTVGLKVSDAVGGVADGDSLAEGDGSIVGRASDSSLGESDEGCTNGGGLSELSSAFDQ
jgi:hypothetical protein